MEWEKFVEICNEEDSEAGAKLERIRKNKEARFCPKVLSIDPNSMFSDKQMVAGILSDPDFFRWGESKEGYPYWHDLFLSLIGKS